MCQAKHITWCKGRKQLEGSVSRKQNTKKHKQRKTSAGPGKQFVKGAHALSSLADRQAYRQVTPAGSKRWTFQSPCLLLWCPHVTSAQQREKSRCHSQCGARPNGSARIRRIAFKCLFVFRIKKREGVRNSMCARSTGKVKPCECWQTVSWTETIYLCICGMHRQRNNPSVHVPYLVRDNRHAVLEGREGKCCCSSLRLLLCRNARTQTSNKKHVCRLPLAMYRSLCAVMTTTSAAMIAHNSNYTHENAPEAAAAAVCRMLGSGSAQLNSADTGTAQQKCSHGTEKPERVSHTMSVAAQLRLLPDTAMALADPIHPPFRFSLVRLTCVTPKQPRTTQFEQRKIA